MAGPPANRQLIVLLIVQLNLTHEYKRQGQPTKAEHKYSYPAQTNYTKLILATSQAASKSLTPIVWEHGEHQTNHEGILAPEKNIQSIRGRSLMRPISF